MTELTTTKTPKGWVIEVTTDRAGDRTGRRVLFGHARLRGEGIDYDSDPDGQRTPSHTVAEYLLVGFTPDRVLRRGVTVQ